MCMFQAMFQADNKSGIVCAELIDDHNPVETNQTFTADFFEISMIFLYIFFAHFYEKIITSRNVGLDDVEEHESSHNDVGPDAAPTGCKMFFYYFFLIFFSKNLHVIIDS